MLLFVLPGKAGRSGWCLELKGGDGRVSWFLRRGNGDVGLHKWGSVKIKMQLEKDLIAVVTSPYEYEQGLKNGIDKNRLAVIPEIKGTGKVYLMEPKRYKELCELRDAAMKLRPYGHVEIKA